MKKAKSNPHGVTRGQIWQSADSRCAPSLLAATRFRVTRVGATHAEVIGLDGTRPRKIRLDRFRTNSTGYSLVSGPVGDAA